MKLPLKIILGTSVILLLLFAASGCVYFNTFYNAKKAFSEAESEREKTPFGQQPRIRRGLYNTAIEKSLKVVENHPNSKYYDDAVYVLGVSYYYTGEYFKAERRFREILANFPESKYVTESRLYLAKAMLEQQDISDAMELFEEIFRGETDRELKSEAAMALGTYHYDNHNYPVAGQYFLAVRDSLGRDEEKQTAQRYIADGLFHQFRWADALGAYLQILGMDPDTRQKYHALYQAAICSYRLQRIETGLDYLRTLAEDEVYYDSVSTLRLTMGEGYEWEDDLDKAEEIYEDVGASAQNKSFAAEAYYRLGLIYQFDYDRLAEAKEYYDKAVEASRGSEAGKEALQLSSNIGKIDEFARTVEIDSTTSQEKIDEAAYTQYQLAELYWFHLNKPDTAVMEMRYVVDSFPTAYDAPKAMIALAQMTYDHTGDSLARDSILHEMVSRYPRSDFVPEALEVLGLKGTAADTGYAGAHLERAEDFLIEDEIDSARAEYQTIVDDFPESRQYQRARFALIWLTEQYQSPGDSSVVLAYEEFADSFSGTEWAQLATSRVRYQPGRQAQQQGTNVADTSSNDTIIDVAGGQMVVSKDQVVPENEDTTGYVDPLKNLYIDPNGEPALDIPPAVEILEVREPFEYPTEAYASKFEGYLYFQIQLDFSGEVVDYVQKTFSDIDEVNVRAQDAVRSTVFDMRLFRPEMLGKWFVYKFKVVLPDHLR